MARFSFDHTSSADGETEPAPGHKDAQLPLFGLRTMSFNCMPGTLAKHDFSIMKPP